jgi:large subunit ribosomal protein L5
MSKPATDAKSKKPGEAKKSGDPKKSVPPKPKPKPKPKGEGKKGAAEKAEAAEPSEPEPKVEPRLRQKYRTAVVPALMQQFGYKNVMQVPRLQKIVVNVGLGAAVANPKLLDGAVAEIAAITGQKPVITRARKSIASFKLRAKMPIGVTVTLRRERMWEFFDRLVTLSLPRVRDFRGVSPRAFDGLGNYTLGLKEQIVFPEVNFDKVDHTHGMNVTFVTTAKTNEEAKQLLGHLGMPFRS